MKRHPEGKKRAGHERWLLTYADLITLLMIFFVVMYALSNVDAQKFKAIAQTLSKALGGGESVLFSEGPSMISGASTDFTSEVDIRETRQLAKIQNELERYIKENNLSSDVSIVAEERGIVISFQDPVLFPLGSAELLPSARLILRKVGQILLKSPNYIRIEGHTDNWPINNKNYPSNWELSVARATTVVKTMINELNFPPQRLSITGYGEYRPRVPNDSEFNRQLNRRVDFVILRSKYENIEPSSQK